MLLGGGIPRVPPFFYVHANREIWHVHALATWVQYCA